MILRAPVILKSDLSPTEVVSRLQGLTGSRYGFTAFHLYDQDIEGRVWADEFWMERHYGLRSVSRRLRTKIYADGQGSKLSGYFGMSTGSLVAMAIAVSMLLWSIGQSWEPDNWRAESVVYGIFLILLSGIAYFQRRRGLLAEAALLRFVEETLDARVIAS